MTTGHRYAGHWWGAPPAVVRAMSAARSRQRGSPGPRGRRLINRADMADAGQHGPQREVPPAVKAIEAELRAEVSLHERDAAMLVGEATAHRDLPYVLAAGASVPRTCSRPGSQPWCSP